ncbi:Rrf2 family transcriptional regulator [Butyricicoccus pullicaecorum]|uniref:Rrf2 family protein n=1 Tax=Butyricicoccus pullicaecorum 1.2 TaxID=1203606 RepID=R8W5Z2_9FIRM|nr:Rrf2 family transcriptional regulator [Butyricicoccus pullicaecorum]EOQ40124.1 Rrf2 family protein [Butyricicoccus pullicaecorum 1.2]SKA67135.1 Rrf2 family protein [Butyricicoccus pullicaecorum DSM 23266]
MQISMKCSVAVHCLIFIHEAKGIAKVTSNLLAESTGSNPVVIRNILSALKKAGLITVPRGTGGAKLCADPSQITLYQIYSALEPDGMSSIIGIHPCQKRPCPIAQNIRQVLKAPYQKIEDSIQQTMERITLQSMIDDFEQLAHLSGSDTARS